ncbi:hypothetical protein ACFVTP_13970 [Streptomyces celluloflavus]|uniref:hypothetical protein n=1 Tax=Streptomyces celluloflavus TaxID=58344 RepID=UPI0036D815E1
MHRTRRYVLIAPLMVLSALAVLSLQVFPRVDRVVHIAVYVMAVALWAGCGWAAVRGAGTGADAADEGEAPRTERVPEGLEEAERLGRAVRFHTDGEPRARSSWRSSRW